MVIDRKIDRYVEAAVSYLPSRYRAEAAAEMKEMLTDLVIDHAGSNEPDILDAREVLRELGAPEIMAMSWLETREDLDGDPSARRQMGLVGRLTNMDAPSFNRLNHIVSMMFLVFLVLAVVFVAFGIIALSTHLISTMLPIFLGCVLGLVAVAGRSVLARQA